MGVQRSSSALHPVNIISDSDPPNLAASLRSITDSWCFGISQILTESEPGWPIRDLHINPCSSILKLSWLLLSAYWIFLFTMLSINIWHDYSVPLNYSHHAEKPAVVYVMKGILKYVITQQRWNDKENSSIATAAQSINYKLAWLQWSNRKQAIKAVNFKSPTNRNTRNYLKWQVARLTVDWNTIFF